MFFSPDLLSRRDSGFGLLWLAATLGSKSSFKKLPKRSVLTADIAHLCDLIAEPAEPLALRLSSNLMVGAARVYKVKQEIFMTDVTHCVSSLKKIIQELHSSTIDEGQLQMINAPVKTSALNLAADRNAAFAMDFDALVADWNDLLNTQDPRHGVRSEDQEEEDSMDQDYQIMPRKKRTVVSSTEKARADAHTLTEHHDHLLVDSPEMSFNGTQPLNSSSQDNGPIFAADNDNFFDGAPDFLDFNLSGVGEELGEGWVGSPEKPPSFGPDLAFDNNEFNIDAEFPMDTAAMAGNEAEPALQIGSFSTPTKRKRTFHDSDKENQIPLSERSKSKSPRPALSPATSFARMLLSQDDFPEELHAQPLAEVTLAERNKPKRGKKKKARLLLDARTELTDEELKEARAQYLEGQTEIRREIEGKRLEKESEKMVDKMLWDAPQGFHAQVLVDFWQTNFKVQVETRTGAIQIHSNAEPPTKRRKIRDEEIAAAKIDSPQQQQDLDFAPPDYDLGFDNAAFDYGVDNFEPHDLRSSEEPGQARRASRPSSALGSRFGVNEDLIEESQKSTLFPWDNAGPSSSNGNLPGSGDLNFDGPVKLSLGGRTPNRTSSVFNGDAVGLQDDGDLAAFPSEIGGNGGFGEDFAFDVSGRDFSQNLESQRSEINLATLERSSHNFLEYVKMQQQSLPVGSRLSMDNIVPPGSSQRRMASSAFYHCLVLATRDLIRLEQAQPFQSVKINVLP